MNLSEAARGIDAGADDRAQGWRRPATRSKFALWLLACRPRPVAKPRNVYLCGGSTKMRARHNVLDLLYLKRRGLSLRLRRTEGSEPQLRRAGREAV